MGYRARPRWNEDSGVFLSGREHSLAVTSEVLYSKVDLTAICTYVNKTNYTCTHSCFSSRSATLAVKIIIITPLSRNLCLL